MCVTRSVGRGAFQGREIRGSEGNNQSQAQDGQDGKMGVEKRFGGSEFLDGLPLSLLNLLKNITN
jgi:hypothetical protein